MYLSQRSFFECIRDIFVVYKNTFALHRNKFENIKLSKEIVQLNNV